MFRSNARSIRAIFAALLLLGASIFTLAPAALAGRAVCRTDPIVTLSDGTVVTLYADLETDLSNVASVDYYLHAPANLSVVSVVHPDPNTADLEHFYFANDGGSGKVSATTIGKTVNGKRTTVTAYMDVTNQSTGRVRSDKRNDDAGVPLYTEVRLNH